MDVRPSILVHVRTGVLRGDNVIDAPYDSDGIEAAIRTALFDELFRETCRSGKNPYYLARSGSEGCRCVGSCLYRCPASPKANDLNG